MKNMSAILFVFVVIIARVVSQEKNATHVNVKYFDQNLNKPEVINIKKCCGLNQTYNIRPNGTTICLDSEYRFDPEVYEMTNENTFEITEIKNFNVLEQFHVTFLSKNMSCDQSNGTFHLSQFVRNTVKILKDGNLWVNYINTNIYGPKQYCVDNFVWKNGSEPKINALICIAEENPESYKLNSTCMLISCFFMVLTVAVYAWLPEFRNLHGMILSAYLLSFLVGFTFMATMQINLNNGNMPTSMCLRFTFIIYFWLLSAFFWLNVMCYDIWRVFSEQRSMITTQVRFLYYSLYAFGSPLLLTIVLAVLEFTVDPELSFYLPHIEQRCFLHSYSQLIYFYGPIIILCVSNLVFFTLTVWKIEKTKIQSRKVLTSSQNNKQRKEKQRFSLYIKLFALMGVNWILEVVSSFYDGYYIFIFTDAYNVLVGLVIFIIFVCKPKTLKLIKTRFTQPGVPKPQSAMQTTNTSLSTRSSSQLKDEISMLPTPNSN